MRYTVDSRYYFGSEERYSHILNAEYTYFNVDIMIKIEHDTECATISFQNGHTSIHNDYNCPSNLFSFYNAHTIAGDEIPSIEALAEYLKIDENALQKLIDTIESDLDKTYFKNDCTGKLQFLDEFEDVS